MKAKDSSNEIRITRVYDAPVSAVWEAWTDPEQTALWWGPRGFSLTTHSKDLRPGGHWNYTMHGPDGVDYPNKTVYLEVEEEKKLVYDHGGNDERKPLFRVSVLFSKLDDRTEMEMTMILPSPEAAEETKGFIRKAGGNATWDRLAEHLEKESSGRESFVINRSFECPLVKMYEMWTDPEHLARWLPPTGSEMEFLDVDVRSGGSAFYKMYSKEEILYGRLRFRNLERPTQIVYTQEFCDEKGNLSRYPALPTWPALMLTTVHFSAEGPKQTRVTVIWEPFGETTDAELQVFVDGRRGMTMGWTGSFDKLEDVLAE